ncbi:hypothetical protein M3P05_13795 [Sansalvadorimonas sp. 2012CJ34-2]|uniref:1-phosphatidylinositol phosphodiesterase n=1 Tax=Parendozoicomonas callyspongiae TaxID=2942213 RepID=A0ABT0PHZ9_9GAMM|nr:hypothetical protein [Sansalvadorimonas sp. 2012CJ34-2]MCL6270999.1 hypothetical protein [Sansalvadorimonas sp. 2012CJ34-2]
MTRFLPAFSAFISLLFLQLPNAYAAPDGQYCLSNRLARVTDALFHNTAIGIKIRDADGSIVTSGAYGSPYHLKWQSKDICLPSKTGGELEIYSREIGNNQWSLLRSYNISWLDGIDIEFHRSGRWDERFGINLKHAPPKQSPTPDADSWMEAVARAQPDIRFDQLCIPGAHITGTHAQNSRSQLALPATGERINYYGYLRQLPGFTPKLAKYYFSSWTKTQARPAGDLLNLGIRYLDLNLMVVGSDDEDSHFEVVTAHGLRGAKLSSILDDIQAFLEANPNEFIILDMQPRPKMPSAFVDLIYNAVEAKLGAQGLLLPPEIGTSFVLAEQLKSKGRIMALGPQTSERKEWMWNPDTLSHLNAEHNRSDLLRKELAAEAAREQRKGLVLVPLYLTPNVQDFTLNPLNISTLEKLNKTLRWPDGIARYTSNALRSQGNSINIVSMDYADQHRIYDFCLAEMNRAHPTPTRSQSPEQNQEPEGSDQINSYKPDTPIDESPEDEKEYPPEVITQPDSSSETDSSGQTEKSDA